MSITVYHYVIGVAYVRTTRGIGAYCFRCFEQSDHSLICLKHCILKPLRLSDNFCCKINSTLSCKEGITFITSYLGNVDQKRHVTFFMVKNTLSLFRQYTLGKKLTQLVVQFVWVKTKKINHYIINVINYWFLKRYKFLSKKKLSFSLSGRDLNS